MIMGSSLGALTLNLFFGIFGFDLNMERWKGNLSEWAAKGGWKGSRRGELNGTLCPIQCHFRFGIIHSVLGTL